MKKKMYKKIFIFIVLGIGLFFASTVFANNNLVIELGLRLSINNAGRFLFGLVFSFFILRSIHLLRNYIICKNWRKPLEIKKVHF